MANVPNKIHYKGCHVCGCPSRAIFAILPARCGLPFLVVIFDTT